MPFVAAWARAFLLTALIEGCVALPLLKSAERRFSRRAGLVFFAQLASHPAVWFIFPELGLSRAWYLVVAEGWALASEALFYRLAFPALTWKRTLGVSLLANGASYAVGLGLRALTGWV
ncbi:MAG: hypothetical protein OZ921_07095 [Sorangiineae bacterium]|nr:hypothetical protein [Polyangiaceae bacterium]MEB2322262.1 hypothetical protein [Sorangiineae bacterium]